MSIARHHAEWLSLVPVSGPFLSLPVLMQAFNAGLEPYDSDHARLLRQAYADWHDACETRPADPAPHQQWVRFVLTRTLDLDDRVLVEGQSIPQTLQVEVPEHHELLRPSIMVQDPATQKPRLLVQVYPPSQDLSNYVAGSPWKASPDTRMTELLHGAGVRLGLVTNGEHWMLVDAPKGETTGYASWYATLWLEEPITLRAFRSLLSASRFFNVPDDQTLEALLAKSASNQQEVTDQLGYQVRRAVEVLIHSLDRADQDFGRELLAEVSPEQLYESALTVMMRLVFLFCAEERELIPSKPFPVYEQNYSVSTISRQLRELADQHGEELLERRYDAWPRLLAAFRAVYGGLQHDDVHIPAYGGNLFSPDRFPFLEGRKLGTSWRDTEAIPLPVNNRTVLHLLEALQLLQIKVPGGGPAEARRLSFRALDIEQIGHVYDATEPFLGLAGTRDREPELPLAELEQRLAQGEADLVKFFKEETGKSESALKKSLNVELDAQDAARFRTACQGSDALWKRVEPLAGLVRLDSFGYPVVIPKGSVFVTAGTDRRSSGTHYTPRSLTEPIVQYTLEPLVYIGPAEGTPKSEWQLKSAKELLDLKICDMACGSGAFLVQAARYMSERLQAEAELTRAEVELRRQSAADVAYASAVRLAELAWREGDVRQARALLNLAAEQATPETRTGLEWKFIDYQISASCRELGDPNADCLCTGISPDGRVIALGDTAGRVQLIDFQSGRTVRVLDTPHGTVRCLRFNATGTQLASCGDDRILCVWNPESGERLFTSPAAPSALQSLCWVRQDGWIAAAGGIGFPGVFLWKVDEGTTESFETGDERVTSLTTSTDQQYLAAGGHDGSIWIWEQADPSLVCRAEYDRSKITGLAFSRDGRGLAVGGTDQMLRYFAFDGHALHDTDEWQLRDDIRDVSCSPIDESLVVLDQFGSIHLANATSDFGKGTREKAASAAPPVRGLRSWEAHERRGWQVDFMPNGLQLVSSGGDGPSRLWDVETKRQPAQLPLEASDKGYEHPLLFTADGRLITAERAVRMWSVDDLAPGHTFDHDGSRAWCLAVSPDGRRLAVGTATAGVLEIHDLKSVAANTLLSVPLPRVDSVAFSPADDVLAVADWEHDTVTIIECESGRSLQTLPARQCHEVAYSPDGRWIAVDDQDDIVVWDAHSFAVEARLQGHLSTILSLTFSPDGQWLASGSRDREIRLWSAADWQFVRGLHGHRSDVQLVRFTSNSRSLIALDGDEYVKVWDPSTGSEVCNLRTPADGPVSRFAISPDTEHLAVRLPDGRVELQRLWAQSTSSTE